MSPLDDAYDLAERVFVFTNHQGEIFDEIVSLIVNDTIDKAVQRVKEMSIHTEAGSSAYAPRIKNQVIAAIKGGQE